MGGDVNRLCLNCMQYAIGNDGVCAFCGADSKAGPASPHHLAPRTVLNGKYLSARVLGEGGFGITYLGWDINLEVKVAIKEFFPLGAVTRNVTVSDAVTALAGNTESLFTQGRERFIEEARRLAKFYNLPGIVSVKDFFLENGTAYIVMEFVEGVTLGGYLDQNGGRMSERAVLEMMRPLIKSLARVHEAGIIHRDISPDNIMLTPDGQLRLIDFGAARDFNDDNKSLSVLLKPGYAPEEQYRSKGKQGPWTDVYALSATLYRAIEGQKPQEALERAMEDAATTFTVEVSYRTNAALMKGLAVRRENRWQSLDELYEALYGEEAPAQGAAPVVPQKPKKAPREATPPPKPAAPAPGDGRERKKPKPIVFVVAAILLAVIIAVPSILLSGGGAGAVSSSSGGAGSSLAASQPPAGGSQSAGGGAAPVYGEQLVVGLSEQAFPMSYLEDGELIGFNVDLIEALAPILGERMGVGIVIEPLPPDPQVGLVSLASGETDCLWGVVADTSEGQLRLSRPLYESRPVLMTREEVGSVEEAITHGFTIGIAQGYFDYLIENLGSTQVQALNDAGCLVFYPTFEELFLEMEEGNLDGAVINNLTGSHEFAWRGVQLTETDLDIAGTEYTLLFADENLLENVEAALEALEADGTLASLNNKWFGKDILLY